MVSKGGVEGAGVRHEGAQVDPTSKIPTAYIENICLTWTERMLPRPRHVDHLVSLQFQNHNVLVAEVALPIRQWLRMLG